MSTTSFETNLNCQSCVAKVKPYLDAESRIKEWSVDTSVSAKTLTIVGEDVSSDTVKRIVEKAGFRVLKEARTNESKRSVTPSKLRTYYPLLLILSFVSTVALLAEVRSGGHFDWVSVMNSFMSGFFLVFAFFKLLDVPAFVAAFQTYDVVARRSVSYGYAYPFIELSLGIAFLVGAFPLWTNLATAAVMGIGIIGVVDALRAKRKIQCACLGTVFNLPMSSVTLVENGVMLTMAIAMIAIHLST